MTDGKTHPTRPLPAQGAGVNSSCNSSPLPPLRTTTFNFLLHGKETAQEAQFSVLQPPANSLYFALPVPSANSARCVPHPACCETVRPSAILVQECCLRRASPRRHRAREEQKFWLADSHMTSLRARIKPRTAEAAGDPGDTSRTCKKARAAFVDSAASMLDAAAVAAGCPASRLSRWARASACKACNASSASFIIRLWSVLRAES